MLDRSLAGLAVEETQHQRALTLHVRLRPDAAYEAGIETHGVIEADHRGLDLRVAQTGGLATGGRHLLVVLRPGGGRARHGGVAETQCAAEANRRDDDERHVTTQ